MDILFSQKKKKDNIFFQKEKELFLNILKDKDDILIQRKLQNKYINSLQNSISNGLILLDKTEINRIQKKKLVIQNNNFENTKNEFTYRISPLKKYGILKNRYLSEKTVVTTPNSTKYLINDFNIRNTMRKKLFALSDRNTRRIQSSHTQKEIKKDIYYDYFKSSKDLNISPIIRKTKKLSKNPTDKKYSKKKNFHNLQNFNSYYNSLESHRILSLKTLTKLPSPSSSIEKAEKKIGIFNTKVKTEKKIQKIFNNTILKFDRNKFKMYSKKKINSIVNKLSECKKNDKKMKEYNYIKKIFAEVCKKKDKNINEIKSTSLSHKNILNKKQKIYKKAVRKFFIKPNREMKAELSKYLKNRNFIIDADNNPYKFKVLNSIYNF